MSKQDLQKFYETVKQDSALQAQLAEAADQESLVQLMVKLGAERGYSFTAEEVAAAAVETSTGTAGGKKKNSLSVAKRIKRS